MVTKEPLLRKDVPGESMWKKEAVYDSWAAWEADYELALAELPKLSAFRNKLGDGPEVLLAWFEEYTRQWDRELRLFVYATMAAAVDASDTEAKAHEGQAVRLWAQLGATAAFAQPELTAIGEELLRWTAKEPALHIYTHYFEELLRMTRYRRSVEVEEILAMLRDPFYNVVLTARELTNTDLTFSDANDSQGNKHEVHQATLPPTGIKSPDREHRRTAWESFYDGHLSMQNTLASNYATRVKQMVALARIRGHESVLEMILAPSNLPVAVFHNVIDTFRAELPVWHRYWDVRRKVLGVEELHPYDIWAPLSEDEAVIPYRQGVEWLCEALAPLGKPYVEMIQRACLDERWVDTRKDDKALRIGLLDETLYNFHRYFFIMPILAQFELEVYSRAEQGQPLTAPILNQIMGDLFAEGYGPTMVDDPLRTPITWAQFSHLYQPFYTFQYAVGIAAAHALAEGVRAGRAESADRYLQFLKSGSSLSPLSAFELAGVDMTTPEPVKKAFAALSAHIDQLEALAA